MTTNRSRVPAGTPTGGQFATEARSESTTTLAGVGPAADQQRAAAIVDRLELQRVLCADLRDSITRTSAIAAARSVHELDPTIQHFSIGPSDDGTGMSVYGYLRDGAYVNASDEPNLLETADQLAKNLPAGMEGLDGMITDDGDTYLLDIERAVSRHPNESSQDLAGTLPQQITQLRAAQRWLETSAEAAICYSARAQHPDAASVTLYSDDQTSGMCVSHIEDPAGQSLAEDIGWRAYDEYADGYDAPTYDDIAANLTAADDRAWGRNATTNPDGDTIIDIPATIAKYEATQGAS